MSRSLYLDGSPVECQWLTRVIDDCARELTAAHAGPGCGVAVEGSNDLPTLVGILAAELIGAPVLIAGIGCARLRGCRRKVAARVLADGRGRPAIDSLADDGRPPLPPETAAVFWTSGTTGEPRAVVLTRAGLAYQSRATVARLCLCDSDRMMLPLSIGHAYGFSVLRAWIACSADLHLESGFVPDRLLAEIHAHRITCLDAVPSMYRVIADRIIRDASLRAHFNHLRLRGCGGDVLPPGLAEWFRGFGRPIHDGYGLTEAGPNVAIPASEEHLPGTVGRPLDGTEVRIDATNGELLVRSPSVMAGYLDDPEATSAAIAGGWLRTGDSGSVDADGSIRLSGRLKEVLIIDGQTYAPAEVEAALEAQRGVSEAAVVGTRSVGSTPVRGDRIVAFVTGEISPSDLSNVLAGCRSLLPPQLRPDEIRCVEILPRLSSGKLDRRTIRHWAMLPDPTP